MGISRGGSELIIGIDKLGKQLQNLDTKLSAKFLRTAAVYAIKPIKTEAKRRVPKGKRAHRIKKGKGKPGLLVAGGFASRQIAHKARFKHGKTTVSIIIGVKSDAYYAVQFVEIGYTTKGGKEIAARPWLKPSLQSKSKVAIERLKQKLKQKIEAEAK